MMMICINFVDNCYGFFNLQLPQINVLSKMDLLSKQAKQNLEMYLEPEVHELLASEHSISRFNKK